jgi:hypothetical protein
MHSRGVNVRLVIVNELLRKVIDHAFDATAQTLRAARLARSDFALDFVSFAFCA